MINNLPEYAMEYPYVVAIVDNYELWFYGAYSTLAEAVKVSQQIHGCVIDMNAEE